MKKTIRAAVAMLIAIIIACGSMTAFAATPADIQCNLTDADEPTTYAYAGELTVGGDAVKISAKEDNNHVYFTFEAEEEGYYRISSTDCSFDGGWFTVPEKYENGVYLGSKDCLSGNGYTERFFYLEKGKHVTCINFDMISKDEFEVDYVGEIVDFVCDDGEVRNLILGYDIGAYNDGNGKICYYFSSSVVYKFSSGESFGIDWADVSIYTDKKLEHGEYEVEVGLDSVNFRKKTTLNIVDITKVISKVEMTNVEKYTVLKQYYDNEVEYSPFESETLTVTYEDGTKEKVEEFDGFGYINGITVRSYYDYDYKGDYVFCVSVANEPFITESCTVELADGKENADRYNKNNLDELENGFFWTKFFFNRILRSETLPEVIENIKVFFARTAGTWLETFAEIMKNTATMLDYIALN